MLTEILSYVTLKVAAIAAAALALLLGTALLYKQCQLQEQRSQLSACEEQRGHLQKEAGASQVQLTSYRAMTEEQNRRVAELEEAARVQQQRADAAEQRAREVRVEYRDRVQKVLVAPVPTGCPEAVRWGAQQARAAAQAWRDNQ